MQDEEIIIKNLQKGINVDNGFKALVMKYQEKLYWHIRSIVNDHEETNDLLQNSFLKAFKNIHRFKGNSKFYTWLYRIATNESLNFINKQKKNKIVGLDEQVGHLNNRRTEGEIDGEQIEMILKNAIEQLPEKQRLVFMMKYYEEMSYKEISEILDTSIGALKASFHHAVKKIERFVKSASYE